VTDLDPLLDVAEHDLERDDQAHLHDLTHRKRLGLPEDDDPGDWWATATPAERNRYRTYRRH
jgi:hypothetical protein